MDRIKVKIINKSGNALPSYETHSAAGMDVRAFTHEPIVVKPMQRVLVPTGLRVQLPQGYEMQIRPRSGLALKHGITLANSPASRGIDSSRYVYIVSGLQRPCIFIRNRRFNMFIHSDSLSFLSYSYPSLTGITICNLCKYHLQSLHVHGKAFTAL